MRLKPLRKIIWSVDAFEKPDKNQVNLAELIRSFLTKPGVEVEPVYILTPGQLNLAVEFGPVSVAEYEPAAERELSRYVKDLGLEGQVAAPKVITLGVSPTGRGVDSLIEYAKKSGADLILLNSHGRKGVRRLIMGSFAETLLLRSPLPAIILGPRTESVGQFKHIVFPTEFGDHSRDTFKRIVNFAREFSVRITLFHAIPHPIEPVLQSGVYLLGGSWIPVQTYFSQEAERKQKRADAWSRWAKRCDVPVNTVIDTKSVSVADAILDVAAKKKADLICMEAQSGPVASVLLGSITRQVLRNAACPVWVLCVRAMEAQIQAEKAEIPKAA